MLSGEFQKFMDTCRKIRYVKLHFTLEMVEGCTLPKYKVSALRGGVGEMLLRANCIRDRDCQNCDFESECIVRRTMYSKMEIQPEFMTSGDSVGYVLECEDYRKEFEEGDQVYFQMILFGKTIVYFSQYLNALFALGMNGLGKDHGRFRIVSITNTYGEELLEEGNVMMSRYKVSQIGGYVDYRMKNLFAYNNSQNQEFLLKFKTPLSVKYQGSMIDRLAILPIYEAVKRRLYMLNCFEGVPSEIPRTEESELPLVLEHSERFRAVPRYSSRQNSKMKLRGIEGEMVVRGIDEEMMELMIAAELVHVGKNTSFGFGRLHIDKLTGGRYDNTEKE